MNGILFFSFRKQERPQKNTNAVYSVNSYSGSLRASSRGERGRGRGRGRKVPSPLPTPPLPRELARRLLFRNSHQKTRPEMSGIDQYALIFAYGLACIFIVKYYVALMVNNEICLSGVLKMHKNRY